MAKKTSKWYIQVLHPLLRGSVLVADELEKTPHSHLCNDGYWHWLWQCSRQQAQDIWRKCDEHRVAIAIWKEQDGIIKPCYPSAYRQHKDRRQYYHLLNDMVTADSH